jgi:asparagine synthase (glutamine-hydrolysing)
MSGIVGMFRPGGGPADQALVRALTRFLSFRGPDGQQMWCQGSVAMGHAMLRTTEEAAYERQPASLEGRLWITADARLDARNDLREELSQAGRDAQRSAPDCDLILQAYAAWGEDCVHHLRGDFAFAIWDGTRKSLFCARDQMGIKPFFYSEHKDFFLFSNTLDCVRLHPDVPDELNEAAIADFLLFGLNCDPATTTFRAIRRLPPAHFLRVSADGLRIGRYWTVPVDGRIRYRHSDEYVENFQIHLRNAVADRMRGQHVGVMLSGGLDSSSLAATARELSPERGESGQVRAYTSTFERLTGESDAPYAREVADFLGIPLRVMELDGVKPFEKWDDPQFRTPEPADDPLIGTLPLQFGIMAADCHVVLNGEGPDNLMYFQMGPHVRDLVNQGHWRKLCTDAHFYLQLRRPLWRGAARLIRRKLTPDPFSEKVPKWMNRDFKRRVDAKARLREARAALVPSAHPVAPAAYTSLFLPEWTRYFESHDAAMTKFPVDVRYPYLDLRIITYMLAIPPFPWFFHKRLLREAMFGRLPESVRRRPKMIPQADPLAKMMCAPGVETQKDISWNAEATTFLDTSRFRLPQQGENQWQFDAAMRPLTLNYWLQHSRPIRYKLAAEARNA